MLPGGGGGGGLSHTEFIQHSRSSPKAPTSSQAAQYQPPSTSTTVHRNENRPCWAPMIATQHRLASSIPPPPLPENPPTRIRKPSCHSLSYHPWQVNPSGRHRSRLGAEIFSKTLKRQTGRGFTLKEKMQPTDAKLSRSCRHLLYCTFFSCRTSASPWRVIACYSSQVDCAPGR